MVRDLLRSCDGAAAPVRPVRPPVRARRLRPRGARPPRRPARARAGLAGPARPREPRPPRGDRLGSRHRRRGRDHDPAAAPVPARRVPGGARARAAAAGRLRDGTRLPAPRPVLAHALRGAVRPHLRRGGPAGARLARPARPPRPHRAARARIRAGRAPALRRAPHRRSGGLRAQAVRDPAPGRAGGRGRRRSRGGVHHRQPVLAAARVQGPAARAAASRLLRRPARSSLRECARARPQPLLDQHVRHLGPGAPVQPARPQRRDQHGARERQLAGRARAAAALGAPGRRPAEALPDRRRALVGLGQARRRRSSCSCSAAARSSTR